MRLPATPPRVSDLLKARASRMADLLDLGVGVGGGSGGGGKPPRDKYLHWSELRYRKPPEGLSSEDWWLAVKIARVSMRHGLPLADAGGRPFWFCDSGYLHRMLHQIDQSAGGRVEMPADLVNPADRERYLVDSLIEEAITSSQLEGAATTRLVAKEMLRSGRSPRDRSERMIHNNYRGMEFVAEVVDEAVSADILLELQRILTEGTLDDSQAVGRFRRPADDVSVVDQRDGTVLHTPPDAVALGERLERLFAFANSPDDEPFIHPVVKAVLLHFMVGYEHPFVDGNGRTARALFYWAMAKSKYWMMAYLPISAIIRKAPAQYARSYLYSEQDDNDVTYFLDYNLRVVLRAIRQLHRHLAAKAHDSAAFRRLLSDAQMLATLNHRQVALLGHMHKHPGALYTIAGHCRSHRVSYQTARTDLLGLVQHGLANSAKHGRMFVFTQADGVARRLREFSQAP